VLVSVGNECVCQVSRGTFVHSASVIIIERNQLHEIIVGIIIFVVRSSTTRRRGYVGVEGAERRGQVVVAGLARPGAAYSEL
jgi:hypothetical protein